MNQFELKRDHLPGVAAPKPYQILCLSGGGYRGLYTAAILVHLEREAGNLLAQVFDLLAGTSIGGILTLGLAEGIPATALASSFEENADLIFPSYRMLNGR